MPLICPPCGGEVRKQPPTTRHAHGRQDYSHDDGTILCLVERNGEAVPATPKKV